MVCLSLFYFYVYLPESYYKSYLLRCISQEVISFGREHYFDVEGQVSDRVGVKIM